MHNVRPRTPAQSSWPKKWRSGAERELSSHVLSRKNSQTACLTHGRCHCALPFVSRQSRSLPPTQTIWRRKGTRPRSRIALEGIYSTIQRQATKIWQSRTRTRQEDTHTQLQRRRFNLNRAHSRSASRMTIQDHLKSFLSAASSSQRTLDVDDQLIGSLQSNLNSLLQSTTDQPSASTLGAGSNVQPTEDVWSQFQRFVSLNQSLEDAGQDAIDQYSHEMESSAAEQWDQPDYHSSHHSSLP